MKMNTACQLNYVISVAYENVEYKKYLENIENKDRKTRKNGRFKRISKFIEKKELYFVLIHISKQGIND